MQDAVEKSKKRKAVLNFLSKQAKERNFEKLKERLFNADE